MAFIPGENLFPSQIPDAATFNIDVESLNGSGINAIKNVSGVEDLSVALVAGANIALTPQNNSKKLIISRSVPASLGGVAATNGSSVVVTHVPPTSIVLSRSLREPADASIVLTPNPLTTDLTITNNQKRTTTQNSGIVLSGGPPSYNITTQLTAGNGISSLPIFPLNQQRELVNTGVRQIIAGTGFSVNNPTGNVVLLSSTNPTPPNTTTAGSGVNAAVVGNQRQLTANLVCPPNTGFSLTPSTTPGNTNIQINNTGVLSVATSSGLSVTQPTPQNYQVSNTGILSIASSSAAIQNIGNANDVVLKFNDPSPNKVGNFQITDNRSGSWNPIGLGATGYVTLTCGGDLYQMLRNGDPQNPNSVWILDMSPLLLEADGLTCTGNISLSVGTSFFNTQIPIDNQILFNGANNTTTPALFCTAGLLAILPNTFLSTFPGNIGDIRLYFTNNTNRTISQNWYANWGTAYYYPQGIS